MMDKLLPILSGSLREIIESIYTKSSDPIAKELLDIDIIVNNFNDMSYGITPQLGEDIVDKVINSRITDEVRMITIRLGEFEVSFLPKGKEPEYGPNRTWARRNRQTGKAARIFQKLLKREFKTREWEIFTNLFKAELCQCAEFELVEGEDIRYWYLDEHYYKCDGTLGNSCMRYSHAQPFFDMYVDNAKMLITKKDGLLTGRAIVWEVDGVTILDRIYTCFDYLENCFIDYAKEHKWWIRANNSLLSTGEDQEWYSPDDDYTDINTRAFEITLKKSYEYYPYVDSFRYFDGDKTIYTTNGNGAFVLDSTDGEYRGDTYTCENCGAVFHGYDGDTPDELHWSDWAEAYYCDDCCWFCEGLDDYVPNSEEAVYVYGRYGRDTYPQSYIDENIVVDPDGTECSSDIVEIDDDYYFVTNRIIFNVDTRKYEIRSNPN